MVESRVEVVDRALITNLRSSSASQVTFNFPSFVLLQTAGPGAHDRYTPTDCFQYKEEKEPKIENLKIRKDFINLQEEVITVLAIFFKNEKTERTRLLDRGSKLLINDRNEIATLYTNI